MSEGQGPARRKRLLTPEEKYEIWVQVLTRQPHPGGGRGPLGR